MDSKSLPLEVALLVRENGDVSSLDLDAESSAYVLEIRKGHGKFTFKHPQPSIEEAERVVEDFLRSWEADRLFQTGLVRREIQIVGGSGQGLGSWANLYASVSVTGPVAEANTREKNPWKRHQFWHLPLVASLVARYEDFKRGRERLTVLGFLGLSALQQAFGGRKALAKALNVDMAILNGLGHIASSVGTYSSARKIGANHEMRELTAAESYWLERVISELIWRSGLVLGGQEAPSTLRLADLPRL